MASGTVRPPDTKMPTQQVKVIQITNVDYHAKLNTSPPAGFPTGSSASG